MRGQILAGGNVSLLTTMHSRVYHLSNGSTISVTQPPISNDHFALFSSRGQGYGYGRDRDLEGCCSHGGRNSNSD